MLVLYGRLTFQPACVFRGLNKGLNCMYVLSTTYIHTYSRVTGPVLAASSTSEMLYRSQWSRSGLSECIHVTVVGHHLKPV